MKSMPDDAAIELAMQLLAIRGPSGNERPVIDFVIDQLRGAGVQDWQICIDKANKSGSFSGEIGNAIVNLPGSIPGSRRLLMAHADTIPLCVGCMPVRSANRIISANPETGLGADDRAGVAVVLQTALNILRQQIDHPPLTLVFSVGEELGMQGVRHLDVADLHGPLYAFNFDGGQASKITIGASGKDCIQIAIQGIPAHAGVRPANGVSAILIASLAIEMLHSRGLLGEITTAGCITSTNIGTFSSIGAVNMVPGQAILEAEIRSTNRSVRDQLFDDFARAFQLASSAVGNVQGQHGGVTLKRIPAYESYCLDDNSPIVRMAADAVRETGVEPLLATTRGGIDANWMVVHGIPTVSFGCGQEDSHTTQEKLNLVEFEQACQIALSLTTTL